MLHHLPDTILVVSGVANDQRVATDDRQTVQKRDMLMFEAGEIGAAELKAGLARIADGPGQPEP